MSFKEFSKNPSKVLPAQRGWIHQLFYHLNVMFGGVYLHLFRNYKVQGKENVPKDIGSYIIAANHTSMMDPHIVGYALAYQPIAYMAKKELFQTFLSRLYMYLSGSFSVDREKLEISTIKSSLYVLKSGNWCLGIFPEGTRQKANAETGEVSSSKKGVAYIANAAKAPILPVGLAWVGKKGKDVRVNIGKIIPYSKDLDQVTQALEETLGELVKEAKTL